MRKRVREQLSVPFLDLNRGMEQLRGDLAAAFDAVLSDGTTILGEQVAAFEREFGAWLGIPHVVGCGSGTDAITLGLLAGGIGPGDEVITVPNTAFPTVTAIVRCGASPRFCDVDSATLLMDPAELECAITPETRAIVPVHLYGNPAPMRAIREIADRHDLWIVEDCAQAHGASIAGKSVGAWGHCGAYSFYPTKNLGALGDAGALVTPDNALADRVRRLRDYGRAGRDHHVEVGMNSRLDEMQAAFLRAKLPLLDAWNEVRRNLLHRYRHELQLEVAFVAEPAEGEGVAHLAVARVADRVQFRHRLFTLGVGTLVHYPVPVHLQDALAGLDNRPADFPIAELAAQEVVSLPCFPELSASEQDFVIQACREAIAVDPRSGR